MNKKEALKIAERYFADKISGLKEHIAKTAKKSADAPGSMESWSDKSKDEFAQLTRALAKELAPLEKSLAKLQQASISEKISLGSFVAVFMNGKENNILIVESGGEKAGDLFLLSKDSELGKTLLGHKSGDTVSWRNGNIQILGLE